MNSSFSILRKKLSLRFVIEIQIKFLKKFNASVEQIEINFFEALPEMNFLQLLQTKNILYPPLKIIFLVA